MPGPMPKRNPARRNRTSTKATLSAVPGLEVPELPAREVGWAEATMAWWVDVWASPMAPEYDESDRHGLFLLAVLVDDYWTAESAGERSKMAAEIRLQRQCFGLTPMDRRRLQWEIERTDEAQTKGEQRRAKAAPPKPRSGAADPRLALQSVS